MRETEGFWSGWSSARPRPLPVSMVTVVGGVAALLVAAAAVAYFTVVDDGTNSVQTEAGPAVTAARIGDPGQPAVARAFDDDSPRPRGLLRVQPGSPSTGPTASLSTTTTAASFTSGSPSVSTSSSPVSTTQTSAGPETSTTSDAGSASTSQVNAGSTDAPATTPTTAGPPPSSTSTAPGLPGGGQPNTTPCSGTGRFERVFRDDFNGTSVGAGWRQYNSIGNNGYGLRRPEAITVAGGNLVITAEMVDGQLVSGGMAHTFDQTYGKYVVRVRTGEDPSVTVSGVVLTWPLSQVHPRDGENNIYETLVYDADRSPFYSVIHKPFGTKSDQELKIHSADGTRFQTMTMEWTPEGITITREGPGAVPFDRWTVTEAAEDLIPDVAHHVTIQLDAWKHSIPGPVRMEVDFIEVHKYCG